MKIDPMLRIHRSAHEPDGPAVEPGTAQPHVLLADTSG